MATTQQQAQQPAQQAIWTPKSGMYKNLTGRIIYNAAGNPITQVNGYYTPKTKEETDLCDYYVSIKHLEPVK